MGRKHIYIQDKSVGKRKGPNRKVRDGKKRSFRKETQVNKDTREGKKLKVIQDAQRHGCPDQKDFLILILSSTAKGMGSQVQSCISMQVQML